jgi:hypothetical protein
MLESYHRAAVDSSHRQVPQWEASTLRNRALVLFLGLSLGVASCVSNAGATGNSQERPILD